MSFDWVEFLHVAQFIRHRSDGFSGEAACRCAASRAYYAAFHRILGHAREHLSFVPQMGPEDHGRLRAHLRATRLRRLALKLNDLRLWRNDCDYRDVIPDVAALADQAISEARAIIDALG